MQMSVVARIQLPVVTLSCTIVGYVYLARRFSSKYTMTRLAVPDTSDYDKHALARILEEVVVFSICTYVSVASLLLLTDAKGQP